MIYRKFLKFIFYIGKGTRNKKLSPSEFRYFSIKEQTQKKKIIECWEENNTVSILQLGWDTNHFEALSYEYAAIQAV